MKKKQRKYIHTKEVHNTKAAEIVLPVLLQYVQPKSVLDVGCGTGTWLKVFNRNGIEDFIGIDGKYVNHHNLQIPIKNYVAHDLTQPLNLGRKFDLIVSLEVAEHLPKSAADVFIQTLINHSKIIFFSAAIPGQGGQYHINEQWPAYWQEKFKEHGYEYYDLIRPLVWNDRQVDVWYRQNMFLVFHESVKPTFPAFKGDNLIHPDFWIQVERLRSQITYWEDGEVGISNSIRTLNKAIKSKASKILNGIFQ